MLIKTGNLRTILGRRAASRKGSALVEFAVVLPLLVLIILGIIEFGRAMMVLETLTHIAREGARRGALSGTSSDEIKEYVTGLIDTAKLPSTDATIGVYVNGSSTESEAASAFS